MYSLWSVYIFSMMGFGIYVHFLCMAIQDGIKELSDLVIDILGTLLCLFCALYVPVSLCLERILDVYKIKNEKVWIKSGTIIDYEYIKLYRKTGTKNLVVHFLCQEGYEQVVYKKQCLYKNSPTEIPEGNVTVVVIRKECLIVLDHYYPEYEGADGTVIIDKNPKMICEMEAYGYLMDHYEVCQEIWKEYVPYKGKGNGLQAELLRLTEFLRVGAIDNENRYWSMKHENACDFLVHYLVYDTEGYEVAEKNKIEQIIRCIRERGNNKENYKNSALFDYIEDRIAEIYLQVHKPIRYHYYEGIKNPFADAGIQHIEQVDTKEIKKLRRKIGGIIGASILVVILVFLGYRAWRTSQPDYLDTPSVQIDEFTLQPGDYLEKVFDNGYVLMNAQGYVCNRIFATHLHEEKYYSIVNAEEVEDGEYEYTKTGVYIALDNTKDDTYNASSLQIYKIKIDERRSCANNVIKLDGIEMKGLDAKEAVESISKNGVVFDEDKKERFLNNEIDMLYSDSVNYQYTIENSLVSKALIIEVEQKGIWHIWLK